MYAFINYYDNKDRVGIDVKYGLDVFSEEPNAIDNYASENCPEDCWYEIVDLPEEDVNHDDFYNLDVEN